MGPVEEKIHHILQRALLPLALEIQNESVHHDRPEGYETHFQILIVSEKFEGMNRVVRHKTVFGLLQKEMEEGVHALALRTLTPAEWHDQKAKVFRSPRHSDESPL